MGSIFSGTSTTSTPLDTSDFVKKTDLVNYANKTTDLTNYAKTTDLTNYANKTTDLANYIKYNDGKKSINVSINSDSDYFTLNDMNNNQIAKFGKNTIIDNINSKQIVIDGKDQMGIILKNTTGGQQSIFSIQNGNDGSDFIRIGQVTLKADGSMDTQIPFIRMDKNTSTGDLTTIMRANVLFSKDINIGEDKKYYNISRDNNMCLSLKYKDTSITPNKDIQIGKWCPPSGTI